jgi:hypothetical protein
LKEGCHRRHYFFIDTLLYLIHILVVSVRVGGALLFAPIWGSTALPHYMRVLIIFSISVVIASVVPFREQAYKNPGMILPAEFLIGLSFHGNSNRFCGSAVWGSVGQSQSGLFHGSDDRSRHGK